MKKILILIIVFLFSTEALLFCAEQREKNELPMYGGGSFTAYEKANNDRFVNGITGFIGSKEMACEEMIVSGWLKFFKGRYNVAMRRFNQAWLLNPTEPRIYLGFSQILMFEKQFQEAVKYLQKSADAG